MKTNAKKITRACVYTRVSTEKQDLEGYSLEEQERLCKATIDSKEYEYVGTFSDPGISGKTMDRPGLQDMFTAIREKKVDAVVILKLDRLSRSQKDTLTIIEDILIKNNITLISVKETLDTSTPWGRAMIGILASFNQLDRENIVQRTTMGRNAKAEKGEYAGGKPPYGYRAEKKTLVVEEGEAEVVRLVYKLKAEGETLRAIADMLNEKGYTNRQGNPFSFASVQKILLNEDVYKGTYTYNDVVVRYQHDPILPEE